MIERFICFSLGKEEFAIPLMGVREVVAIPEVTALAHLPSYFLGIINLRGQIITVLDLRIKLGTKALEKSENTVIICDISPYVVGILVDSVNRVISLDLNEIEDRPDVVGVKNSEFILKVYQLENSMILFLNLAKALGLDVFKNVKIQGASSGANSISSIGSSSSVNTKPRPKAA